MAAGGRRTVREGWRSRWDDACELTAARTGVSPRAVLGLLVMGLLVVAVLATRVALARSGAQPVPLAPTVVGGAPASSGTASVPAPVPSSPALAGQPTVSPTAMSPTAGVTAGPGATGQVVVVHVVGRVRHPGVVRLPSGSRVQQAVAAAGGARPGADLSRVNLARPLVDGEQVVVPRPGESVLAAPAGPGAMPGVGAGGGAAPPPPQPVDLNSASLAELDALPGVGPVLAQRILAWRTENGRFTSVEELTEVSGIGDAVLGRLRPLVRV